MSSLMLTTLRACAVRGDRTLLSLMRPQANQLCECRQIRRQHPPFGAETVIYAERLIGKRMRYGLRRIHARPLRGSGGENKMSVST
jgi:hypothetical protein